MYTKIHHAYIDGMSGVKRIYGSLSTSPRDTKVVPSWSYVPEKKHRLDRQLRSGASTGKTSRVVLAQAKAVTELSSSLARMSLEFLNLREGKAQMLFHAPRTRMNDRIEFNTRSIATCTLPLDRAREVGAKFGGKINDVILTVIDAALHDYLEAHSENTNTALVALCPMSLRDEGNETATTQATVLHVRLGSPDAKPRDRLRQVIESSSVTKQEARSMSTEALMDFSMALFGVFEFVERSGLGRMFSPSYNVLISNVPGPSEDVLYLRGSKQLASYPISAFLPGGNLNVTVLSHGNKLDFGLVADKHALPDLQFVTRSITKQFAELENDVPGKKSTVSRTKKVKMARKRATGKAKAKRL
jgi:WS/DGAT/MGAT family acyltransferase